MPYTISPKPRVFILTSQIYETAGGRTKATIARMMLLQEHFETTLIEMSAAKYPGQELPAIFAKYHTEFPVINPWTGSVPRTASTKNYLKYLQSRTGNLGDSEAFRGAQQNFTLPTLTSGRIKTYVENGTITRLREYHADGRVEFFALDNRQNIFLRELYEGETLLARHYLNDAGDVQAGFTVDKNGDKTFVYRQSDGHLTYSNDVASHSVVFLKDVLRPGDVVISDVRYYDAALAELSPEIRKIHVWHEIATDTSGHTINPAYETSVKPGYPMGNGDKIVVFTNDARAEYDTVFPHLQRFFTVIPYGTSIKTPISDVTRDKNLIMSIGRLVYQKDVFAQIRAFSIFHQAHPDTYFKIFGDGKDKAQLQELVEELRLQHAVEFCGFSSHVDGEFQRAAMMIFSSRFETFGLTVMESLSNGTPVASYDVRFGTKAMIKNRQNGIIAHQNTPESLADAMENLYSLQLSSQEVQRSIKNLSHEQFEKNWLALIANSAGEQ